MCICISLGSSSIFLGMKYLLEICPDDLKLVLDYFWRNYVERFVKIKKGSRGLILKVARRKPLYAITEWNVHDATINGSSRTNNFCEAWNNGFFHLVDKQS